MGPEHDSARLAAAVFANRVRARFGERLRSVCLYGSQARDETTADSDVDVFVRVDAMQERERGELFELAADVSLAHLVTLQAFAPLPTEYDWLERNECRIIKDIQAEGLPL